VSSLILKDILLQKKAVLFTIGYSLFILIAFQNPVFSEAAYIMGAVASGYMFILGACAYDEKNKSDIVLNSLPVKRAAIVRAKYAGVLVFTAIALLIIGLMGAVMKGIGLPVPQRYIGWPDMAGAFASLGLLASLYYPFAFRFGYIKSRMFNLVLFMLVFFSPAVLSEYLKKQYSRENLEQAVVRLVALPDWLVGLGLVLAVLALLQVSLLLSIRFYKQREF
jgi:ABC-type transport system involved in multi-copper enzyme maturation permease subunit